MKISPPHLFYCFAVTLWREVGKIEGALNQLRSAIHIPLCTSELLLYASVVITYHHTSYRPSSLPGGLLLCCTVLNRRTLPPFGNTHGGRPSYKLFRHSLKSFSSSIVTALQTPGLYPPSTHRHTDTRVSQNVPNDHIGKMSWRSGRERLSVSPEKGGTL